jgi:hypothetical protein
MKTILKLILSAIILFGAVPTVNAMDMKMDNMEEIKKKKKKKGKKVGKKGKKSKKGFFSKVFGSK